MITALKSFAAAAIVTLGASTVVPNSAQADSYLGLGGGRSGPSVEFFIGDDGREFGRHDRDGRRDDWRRDRHEQDRSHRRDRGCGPEMALWKAERMGVRRARVVDVDRRSIDVVGRSRGDRVYLTFARVPGCPLIRG